LNFLSINRFERKKNIDLAISAFAMLHTLGGDVFQNDNLDEASLTIAGKSQPIFLTSHYH
jgi:alpha-1,3/alpha-1,6-mannosyltransferase